MSCETPPVGEVTFNSLPRLLYTVQCVSYELNLCISHESFPETAVIRSRKIHPLLDFILSDLVRCQEVLVVLLYP